LIAKDGGGPVRQAVGSTGHSADPGIARQLSELARELQADLTTEALLRHIMMAALTEVPGTQHAGITLVTGREFATPAASDELAERIDQIQYETDEGPCLDAARHHETVRCDDLRTEARWPRFARQAADLGVLSMLSFQLFAGEDSFGALNLYAGNTAAFGQDSESSGILLASHAALAMAAARTQAGLLTALDSREMIGQAKGILMERYKITGVEAFGLLVASSQAMNRKLRAIAEHLVATGELLTPPR
jgi:transcriptional regulator with GAF, ATPase, and Fis domain